MPIPNQTFQIQVVEIADPEAALPGVRPRDDLLSRRFGGTFATELLLAGVPLECVSVLLGLQGVKIAEKHYSPSIRERQEQAEADVRRTWAHNPMALLANRAKPRGHGKREAMNSMEIQRKFWRRGWDSTH